jgi:hypothetical protein
MKKKYFFTLSFVLIFPFVFFSCDNAKTPQEYLREEKKAIERYINQNKINVINYFPEDRPFAENEYFRTNEGLYFRVVKSGNGKKVNYGKKEKVMVRFDYYFEIKTYVGGDTTQYKANYTQFPMSFRYGIGSYSGLACEGWEIPLLYVTEGAIVDLIIPSSLGSQNDKISYLPVFYGNLEYTHFK